MNLKKAAVFVAFLLVPALVLGAVFIVSNSPISASDARAYFLAGNAHAQAGDYTAAVISFEKAVSLAPDYEKALNNLAFSYSKLGEFEKAAVTLKELLQAHPNTATYYYDYAVNIVLSLQKDKKGSIEEVEDALAAFKKADELSPGFQHARENIAFLEDLKKQYYS